LARRHGHLGPVRNGVNAAAHEAEQAQRLARLADRGG
jgi:hypothetical protein